VSEDRLHPQAEQMADESMVRNLAAQAEAIWPQEAALYERYGLTGEIRILDVGCGTGEISARLLSLFPGARLLGVDLVESHLARAAARCAPLGGRGHFARGSAYTLPVPSGTFDLVVCRHMLQAVRYPDRILSELSRVTRPGGRLHLIVEDYGMIHFPRRRADLDPDRFWREGPVRYGEATGTDLHIGRDAVPQLARLGMQDIALDYVVVDTLRVSRETFARIWIAWRDGYAEALAQHTAYSREEVEAHFDDMIATLRDSAAYAVWMVPVLAARAP
jgi:SAM-dependent methyltransferase